MTIVMIADETQSKPENCYMNQERNLNFYWM